MKLIILDRDGVINEDSAEYIKSPDEWIPIPSSLAAIAQLTQAGYILAVASNQSGIGRKLYSEETLQQIHEKMLKAIKEAGGHISKIVYCPHIPDDNCKCRKPKPGMLLEIAKHFQQPLEDVIFIGDKISDLQAGTSAGCKTILVKTGYGESTLQKLEALHVIPIYENLIAATFAILNKQIK